jgi:hypothetical protein
VNDKKIIDFCLWFFALCVLVILMTSCAPDPRREAQAFQIREQTEQDVLNQTQNRAHAEQLQLIQVQERQAIAQENIAAWKRSIKFISIFGTIAICIALLALAVSFSYGSFRFAMASARRADVRANLLPLDPATRQFALLLHHVHGGKWSLHNPNTGSVLMLDESIAADRQLIATAGATQIAGVIAQEASKSNDPAGVSVIKPPIVDVTDGALTIGTKDTRRHNE